MNNLKKTDVKYLFTPVAIRETTKRIYDLALSGKTNFIIHEDKVSDCAELVLEVTKKNYPELDIPFHSRWGHFKVGGIDREATLDKKISHFDKLEQARIKLELVIASVLLDAGAGPAWKYIEGEHTFNRSEGLAVASFDLFMAGAFASENGLCADAKGLQAFSQANLEKGFQVSDTNPLVGIPGRVKLIKTLGDTVAKRSDFFKGARLGGIIDYLIEKHGTEFEVQDVLTAVLEGLGDIWPSRLKAEDINLGDIWHYPSFGDLGADSVVCFHKLSQWLTYSLVAPIELAGVTLTGAEKLTGLAEYRNGGLFLDFGVIELRDKSLLEKAHTPDSELIIEWRALTVQLLDRVGAKVQALLGKDPSEFPLAKVLEGGTWWAGRKLAAEKRSDSSPPIKLASDGTVF